MTIHAYKCNSRQIKDYLIDCYEAQVTPFIQSSPGMGKSALVHAFADEYGLELIDHRLSTSLPEDLSGLPDLSGEKAKFKPFDFLPIKGDPVPKNKEGWLLFLDEFNSAKKEVQAAAYKLILDRMTGQHKLHEKVVIVCAGNLATDRAIVNPLSTAMQSRVIHLEMELIFKIFMQDVAIPQMWDPRVMAYLNYKEDDLMDFKPDHNDKTFCCPRTWDFTQRLIKGKTFNTVQKEDGTYYFEMDNKAPLLAGTITSGKAVSFIRFSEIGQKMPTIREIVNDPKGTPVPMEPEIRWCTITHVVEKLQEDTFENIATYINRFDANFRVLFFRSLLVHQPKLRHHPVLASAALELAKYLND
ncbi:ATPase domain-containing protein [Rhizobium phage RHph_X2_28B]|uniref:ATPase n=1 Tax=Rhizobium phage RHph_X2_28B TaxID=2836086 RepID=UPI0023291945|nr:ATPase [Rhizobium phage RHph_X2_28B]QWY83491.1 ATPase domain-containing protein [Rhizobium phage RHph_X2_28B]QWY83727.1 ATPase domain-containing protein [Rhizobium phage RHph_X3_15]